MCQDDPLPAFHDRAPRDRYCDLILTGGVTSAIAYPAAIFALAQAYRFNAIGGSSSGAGSAALAAAAEYRRRHGSPEGFRLLLERTDEVSHSFQGRTGLEWLFQPEPQHQRLFKTLVRCFATPKGRPWAFIRGLLDAYGMQLLAGLLVLAGLAVWLVSALCLTGSGKVLAYAQFLFLGLGLAVVLLVLFLAWAVTLIVRSDYGLCTGLGRVEGAARPPLTEWLHGLIQELAGRRADDPPLSFADLRDAPGSPRETLGDLSAPGAESIRLQMFTANLTHGRPYLLPLDRDDPPLYFRPSEMRRLFPESVVDHMVKHADEDRHTGADLKRLPTDHLPIVVAARMSVSFPVLFTAVPLWALDEESGSDAPRRCLFVDGSLCSNFPIHLFDSLVPAWPTFGISLYPLPEPAPGGDSAAKDDQGCCELHGLSLDDVVTLPSNHHEKPFERWNRFDDKRGTYGRLKAFVGAMFDTTIDWNDAMQARLLGVHDRVVRVGLPPGIGGLNILMNRHQMRCLAQLGARAAVKLLERFAVPTRGHGLADGWTEHRWVRFDVLRRCLTESLAGLTWSIELDQHAGPMPKQIRRAVEETPLLRPTDRAHVREPKPGKDPDCLLASQAAALQGVLDALKQAEQALNAPASEQPTLSGERPDLRIRPSL